MNNISAAIEKWINPVYVEAYRNGTLPRYRCEAPFRHAVLPNFFSEDALKEILEHAERTPVEMSHRKGIAEKTDWYWGAFPHLEFIRFFLGQDLRQFLNELSGLTFVLKKKAIPQFNLFRPSSPGIPLHTDVCEEVGAVTLIQLSQGYEPGLGGELIFHRREGGVVLPDQVIAPECNKLIMFEVSKKSFHSVADMRGDWTRRTITYDWITEEMQSVSHTKRVSDSTL